MRSAAQIEQRMQFDGCFGRAEHGSRKYGQTQIDGRGVDRVDSFLQLDAEGLLRIQSSGNADQALSEIGIDAPVSTALALASVLRATAERIPR